MSVEMFETPMSLKRRTLELSKRFTGPSRKSRTFNDVWNDATAVVSMIAFGGLIMFMVWNS